MTKRWEDEQSTNNDANSLIKEFRSRLYADPAKAFPSYEESLSEYKLWEAIDQAQKNGFIVVRSTPRTLLLDLDTGLSLKQFETNLPLLQKLYPVRSIYRWSSKSGHTHIKIRLKSDLSIAKRIALQALLGSDSTREMLVLKRVSMGIKEPCLLFRPKDSKVDKIFSTT